MTLKIFWTNFSVTLVTPLSVIGLFSKLSGVSPTRSARSQGGRNVMVHCHAYTAMCAGVTNFRTDHVMWLIRLSYLRKI